MYINKNVNPMDKKVDDCSIRSVSLATGIDWHKVYFELCKIGDKMCDMPNSTKVVGEYLKSLGFTYGSYKVKKGERRPTVKSFCSTHPRGTFVLRAAHHLVCVIDGNYYDIWDCGDCAVYSWYQKIN